MILCPFLFLVTFRAFYFIYFDTGLHSVAQDEVQYLGSLQPLPPGSSNSPASAS